MEHSARKITKIAREAEHLVLLATRADGIGTAEIDCLHAVRHHPGVTQAELVAMLHSDKAAIARRTANLERKGYLRRAPNPSDGRSQLLYATEQAEGLRNVKAEAESARRSGARLLPHRSRQGLPPLQGREPRGFSASAVRYGGRRT